VRRIIRKMTRSKMGGMFSMHGNNEKLIKKLTSKPEEKELPWN
jgi:hypothetical protein